MNTTKRRTVEVELFSYGYSDEYMPLADFVAEVTKALESVPEQYRDTATFTVDYRWGDDGSTTMKGAYQRPETDEEVAEREATARRWAEQAAINERRTYELLRAKYEK